MGFIYNSCSVLETLRNTCSSSESSSQESKRQRLSSDGAANPGTCSPGSVSFWREVGHQASHVYRCLGIRLGQQNKLTDALHFLRMSLQSHVDFNYGNINRFTHLKSLMNPIRIINAVSL